MFRMMEYSACHRKPNASALREMFDFGIKEWNATSSKYNRYIQFAFMNIDNMLAVKHHSGNRFQALQGDIHALWNDLPCVHFIEDYLNRSALRLHGQFVSKPIELILTDALRSDGSWNTHRLILFARHPTLFFDFEFICWFAVRMHSIGNDMNHLVLLLHFYVDHDLIEWFRMPPRLCSLYPFAPELKHYVSTQVYNSIRERIASERWILTPETQGDNESKESTESTTYVAHQTKTEHANSFQRRCTCCLAM